MKFRKIMLIMLVALLAIITACSSNNAANNEKTNTPAVTEDQTKVEDISAQIQSGTYKFEKPVTMTTVMASGASDSYKPGETADDNVATKWAKNQLGIDIKYLWTTPADQMANKARLMLASNEKKPDVIFTDDPVLFNDLVESGKFKDIGADYDKYASPEMKKAYSLYPDQMWNQVTYGGKRMAIPYFNASGQNNGLLWIRQDWLDKLGLKAPTTIDEMAAVLEAFKNNEAKLGVKDIIPLGLSLKSGNGTSQPFTGWFGESSPIFGAFGAVPGQWNKAADGKLVYGTFQPEIKQGLSTLADWYKKGYISKEAALQDEGKVAELVIAGKVGMVIAPLWAPSWPIPDMMKNNPGAILESYPLPKGANGKAAARDTVFASGGLLVSKDFEHTDALFLWLNRVFTANDPKAGSEFEHGWFEGYDYVLKDGVASTDGKDFPDGKRYEGTQHLFFMKVRDPFAGGNMAVDIFNGKKPETPLEKKFATNSMIYIKAVAQITQYHDDYWPNQYTGVPTETQLSKGAVLGKIEAESLLKIIYGKDSIDSFDNAKSQWESAGGTQLTKEVNEKFNK